MACFSFVCRSVVAIDILLAKFFISLEKEQARTMISAALRGLKESDRTGVDQTVDLNSLSNFVEK